jgi:endonuclease-8
VAEGDTIRRAAARIGGALGGEQVSVVAPNPRGRAAGVERLDGHTLDRVDARGKHLLLHFGDLILHSHLGMSGSWQVYRRGDVWRKQAGAAWVVLKGEQGEAVQFGGPTLRVLAAAALHRDPVLSRLGPDILDEDFDPAVTVRSLRTNPHRGLGDALLDQTLVAGIGNIFKSEACFAARLDPWQPITALSDDQLTRAIETARALMQSAVEHGRPSPVVYRRAGQPCPVCATPIRSHGQGDTNRSTYWCPVCQG